jgi:ribosome maturation factor RimP
MKRDTDPTIVRLGPEIESTLQAFGYELVKLNFGGGGSGRRALNVLIDKPGGVTIEDCRYMAKRLGVLLDSIDPIPGSYTLMVSSPGINRPLTRDHDFERFAGESIYLRWSAPGARGTSRRGILRGVREGNAVLEVEGEEVLAPLDQIDSASILYDWDREAEDDESEPGEAQPED